MAAAISDELKKAYDAYMSNRLKILRTKANLIYHRKNGDDVSALKEEMRALKRERKALPITVYQVKKINAANRNAFIREIADKMRPTYDPPRKKHRYDAILEDIDSGINDDSILCRHKDLDADTLAVYHKIVNGTLADLNTESSIGAFHHSVGAPRKEDIDEGLTPELLGYTPDQWKEIPPSTRWRMLHPKRAKESARVRRMRYKIKHAKREGTL